MFKRIMKTFGYEKTVKAEKSNHPQITAQIPDILTFIKKERDSQKPLNVSLDDYLSSNEASKYLDTHITTLTAYAKRKKLRRIWILNGKKSCYFYKKSDLDKLLKKLMAKGKSKGKYATRHIKTEIVDKIPDGWIDIKKAQELLGCSRDNINHHVLRTNNVKVKKKKFIIANGFQRSKIHLLKTDLEKYLDEKQKVATTKPKTPKLSIDEKSCSNKLFRMKLIEEIRLLKEENREIKSQLDSLDN